MSCYYAQNHNIDTSRVMEMMTEKLERRIKEVRIQ